MRGLNYYDKIHTEITMSILIFGKLRFLQINAPFWTDTFILLKAIAYNSFHLFIDKIIITAKQVPYQGKKSGHCEVRKILSCLQI